MGAVTCTMPNGEVVKTRVGYEEPSPEYVVAVRSRRSDHWTVRGWFPLEEDAERCEAACLLSIVRERVALLAVDDPEGDD